MERLLCVDSILKMPVDKPVDVIMDYLEEKKLLVKPTDSEYSKLHDIVQQSGKKIADCIVQELRDSGLSFQQINSKFENDLDSVLELKKKIVHKMASGFDMPVGFRRSYIKIENEIELKMTSVYTGGDIFDASRFRRLKTMSYSVPTCPGSSGAHVRSIDCRGDKRRVYNATHSMGGGKTGVNYSGLGVLLDYS